MIATNSFHDVAKLKVSSKVNDITNYDGSTRKSYVVTIEATDEKGNVIETNYFSDEKVSLEIS